MSAFTEIIHRDAYSTIRGYVYQVDYTILRWLNLKPNEVLELEKGEDIDIVTSKLGQGEIQRELEQIKHRDSNLSLNTEDILEAILNFHIHQLNNPSKKLLFRFITNSKPTLERPIIVKSGKSGIEAWIELYNKSSIKENDSDLNDIKSHLMSKANSFVLDKSQKRSDNTKNWESFRNFLTNSNEAEFRGFLKAFELSTGNIQASLLDKNITDELLRLGHSNDYTKAKHIYSVLFVNVFKLLTQKGLKRLTKRKLERLIKNPVISQTDIAIYSLINNFIHTYIKKIDTIESNQNILADTLQKLKEDVESIASTSEDINLSYSSEFSINPPNILKFGTLRQAKVEELYQIINRTQWLALQGAHGLGKTQLATLLTKRFKCAYWLDLKPFTNYRIFAQVINSFLSRISNIPLSSNREDFYYNSIKNIPNESLIIINDLPLIEYDTDLSSTIISIANSLNESNCRLLTTSNYKINNSVKSIINNYIVEYYDFEFNSNEIFELLTINGAGEKADIITQSFEELQIKHPRIVDLYINRFKAKNWNISESDLLFSYLQRDYQNDLISNTQLLIKKYIQSEDTRNLLYRISLSNWDLSLTDIKCISEIEKPIPYPSEKLLELVGPWITERENSYTISPLAYNVGENNLAEDEIRAVHKAFANALLSTQPLGLLNSLKVINYFIKAEEFDSSGYILYRILNSVKTVDQARNIQSWGCLTYWNTRDFPDQMAPLLQIIIKYEQIRVYSILDINPDDLINQLEKIAINSLQSGNNGLFVSALINIIQYFKLYSKSKSFLLFSRFLKQLILEWVPQSEQNSFIKSKDNLKTLLSINIDNINSSEELLSWFDVISSYEERFKESFFTIGQPIDSLEVLAQILVGRNINKDSSTQVQDNIVEVFFNFLNNNFYKPEIALCKVIVTFVQVKIRQSNNIDDINSIGNNWLKKLKSDEGIYELAKGIGLKLFTEDKKSSLYWLRIADKVRNIEYDFNGNIDVLITLSVLNSNSNSAEALEYCKKAVEISTNQYNYDECEYLILLGELAISYWINGENKLSLECFENITTRLFEAKTNPVNPLWVRVFKFTTNCLSYISHKLNYQDPNKQSLTTPYQGIYYQNNKDFSELYSSNQDQLIYPLLASFSSGIEDLEKANYWSEKAFDSCRVYRDQENFIYVSLLCNQYSIINCKFDKAFEYSLIYYVINNYNRTVNNGAMQTINELTYFEIESKKPSLEWDKAERGTLLFMIFPSLMLSIKDSYIADNISINNYNSLKTTLIEYRGSASNQVFIEEIITIIETIYCKKFTINKLYNLGVEYKDIDEGISIFYFYGILNQAKDIHTALVAMATILPVVLPIFTHSKALFDYVLAPYIKFKIIELIKNNFMGARSELNNLFDEVNTIELRKQDSIKKLIGILVREFDEELPESNGLW